MNISNYLIEFSIIHLVLTIGYWLLLRKERQYAKMRFYLLASSLLAIIIPLIKLPKLFPEPEAVQQLYPIVVTPMTEITVGEVENQIGWGTSLLAGVYLIISCVFIYQFLRNLYFLFQLESKSTYKKYNNTYVRSVKNIEGSFTFFNWIFLNHQIEQSQADYEVILKHERAHVQLGHSYDLMFFELFKIFFWWLPSAWFVHKEIKKIHEYQADAYALKSYGIDQYSSILISSTLKSNGLSLASSFHDGLILKRLKAMKQQVKKVSPWKLGVLGSLCMLLFILFACSEDAINAQEKEVAISEASSRHEAFTVVEEQPSFQGGMGEFYNFVRNEIRYPKEARENGIEGKVFVQFVIEKDGSLSNVKASDGIGSGCDQEAIRVVKSAPNFLPGKQRGKAVRVKMEIPIVFQLNQALRDKNNIPGGIVIVDEAKSKLKKLNIEVGYQDGEWIGTVYDSDGNVMPGASIIIAGTTKGTVSDLNGSFKISAKSTDELNVSFVGFESVRLKKGA